MPDFFFFFLRRSDAVSNITPETVTEHSLVEIASRFSKRQPQQQSFQPSLHRPEQWPRSRWLEAQCRKLFLPKHAPPPQATSQTQSCRRKTMRYLEVRCSFITTTVREQNPTSHHKAATGRVRTGKQRLPLLCH